jgi:hypothetical protein
MVSNVKIIKKDFLIEVLVYVEINIYILSKTIMAIDDCIFIDEITWSNAVDW